MIYISILSSNKAQANAWVKENVDPAGGEDTFVENFLDSNGNKICLISLPDSGDKYTEAMKAEFTWTYNKPTVTAISEDSNL